MLAELCICGRTSVNPRVSTLEEVWEPGSGECVHCAQGNLLRLPGGSSLGSEIGQTLVLGTSDAQSCVALEILPPLSEPWLFICKVGERGLLCWLSDVIHFEWLVQVSEETW